MPTVASTKQLVMSHICGNRIGCDVPNYVHSLRVYESLVKYGFDVTTCMAGLLHDIVEDSEVTFDDLKALGYDAPTLHLVDLATHDARIEPSLARWIAMMERLIQAQDPQARAVKLADISDNLTEVHLLKPHNFATFINEKCPPFIYWGNVFFGGTAFYTNFLENYFVQVKRLYQYFNH